jgi:acetylglutamate kinase
MTDVDGVMDAKRTKVYRKLTIDEANSMRKSRAIGEGMIPWTDVFHACETVAGTEWYIVEHESYEGMSPLEAIRLCLVNIREMGR